jgi:pimeloyl-ACP methyl ester carboxylesterase
MRKAWLALVLAAAAAGCSYVRSAMKQALDEDRQKDGLARQIEKRQAAFPAGTIRALDDAIFSHETTELGFFDPAAFLERAPLLFYALEEQSDRKIPVVFVHGIRGSASDFAGVVQALDRTRYQPWFFHYPSGAALSDLSQSFERLFLSGQVIRSGPVPMVIVAHSMGGLIVREALNRCARDGGENQVARLVTLASPMGGTTTAAGASQGVLVIRSWKDLDPGGPFIAALHRRPLPPGLEYHLFFAYGDDRKLKMGENSDGVVPLASQLDRAAQSEASAQFGFDDTHSGILRDPEAIRRVLEVIDEVRPEVSDGSADRRPGQGPGGER